ncbi:MAG: 3'-5' exoribonuclease [Candidatus Lokiarchaeota archaeon]
MNNVMLDLETLGDSSDAVILAIGAIKFDVDTNKLGEIFYRNISIESCLYNGLTVTGSTIEFWLKQDKSIIDYLFNPEPIDLIEALIQFSEYLGSKNCLIWGNGSDFDNVILKNAYLRCNYSYPWNFRNNRCFRTFKNEIFIHNEKIDFHRQLHHALNDAIFQAKYMLKAYEMIREGKVIL